MSGKRWIQKRFTNIMSEKEKHHMSKKELDEQRRPMIHDLPDLQIVPHTPSTEQEPDVSPAQEQDVIDEALRKSMVDTEVAEG